MKPALKKTLAACGILAGIGALGYFAYKRFKKTEEKCIKKEEEENEALNSLGVKVETLREHGVSIDEQLIRGIHTTISHSKDWDDMFIDPDRISTTGEAIVHLVESVPKTHSRPQLDFIFELPNICDKGYRYPKIGDFKAEFGRTAMEMFNIVGANGPQPFVRLEAYAVVDMAGTREELEKDLSSVITIAKKIPPTWYKDFHNDRNDGVLDFYKAWNANEEKINKEIIDNIIRDSSPNEDITEEFLAEKRELFDIRYLFLGWRISMPEQAKGRGVGINLISAVQCLKWIVDNFEVKSQNSNKTVKADLIICHAFDPHNWSAIPDQHYTLNGTIEDGIF